VERLFRWIEQFDDRLDWQHDDPFFELDSVTDWTTDDPSLDALADAWDLDGVAA
jgi:hypothetical protein